MTSLDASHEAPESQGVNSIEIWIISCVLMVFAALSEYGLLLFIKFRKSAPIQKDSHKPGIQNGFRDDNGGKNNFNINTMGHSKGQRSAVFPLCDEKDRNTSHHATTSDLDTTLLILRKIDYICLYLFPITFSLFVIIYLVLCT